jgi:predicted dehydrogenase
MSPDPDGGQLPVRNPAAAVGLIGLGEIGQVHATAIRRSPAARLAAVADTAAELLRPFAAEGLPAYQDAGDLIADPRVGTVSVCLPHDLHFPVAMQAVKAGKNVLVEKPFAIDPGQCQQLIDAARASGVKLGVSHNQVFYAAHIEAKRLIDSGAIEIVGSDAILRFGGIESLSFGYRGGPALTMFRDRQWSEVPVPDDDWRSSVKASVIAYLDAVTAGREPPVTGADGLQTVRLIHRIYDKATILSTGTGP